MDLYLSAIYLLSLVNLAKGLLCSVCASDEDPDCEAHPPDGRLCWQSGSGVHKSCNIIREYKLNTKIQLMFRRDCSTMDESACYDPPGQNRTLCVDVCFTDNCNSASTLSPCMVLLLMPLMSALMVFMLPLSTHS